LSTEEIRNILILAGGGVPPDLAAAAGTQKRCLISLGGKTLLERMLDVVDAALGQPRAVVNLGVDDLGKDLLESRGGRYTHYCCGGSLLDAMNEGVAALRAEQGDSAYDGLMLMLNVDLPLMDAGQLRALVDESLALEADGVWPVVEKKIVQAQFPDTKRTYVRTRQGTFTGGNVFLLRPRLIRDNQALLEKTYQARKNPMALASLFSKSILMRVLSGTVSIPDLEGEFSQRFNTRLRMLPFKYPGVAVDLDKLADYEMMKRILG
jgi:hypothetical protein